MSRRRAFANSRQSSMERSRRSSGIAVGVPVRTTKYGGVEYAEEDLQVPMFSVSADISGRSLDVGHSGSRRGRRRRSEQSDDSIDYMSLIIDSPSLWREFKVKLKESGNVTGHRGNTKEVLRKFVAEKGLDEAQDDAEDVEPTGRRGRSNSFFRSFGSSDSLDSLGGDDIDSRFNSAGEIRDGKDWSPQARRSSFMAAASSARMIAQASASSLASAAGHEVSSGGGHRSARRSFGERGREGRNSSGSGSGRAVISLGGKTSLEDHLSRIGNDDDSSAVGARRTWSSNSVGSFQNRQRSRSECSLPSSLLTAMRLADARAEEREKEKQNKREAAIRKQDARRETHNEQFKDDTDDLTGYIIKLGEPVRTRPRRAIKLAHSRGANAASSTSARQVRSMRTRSLERSLSYGSCDSIDELSIESGPSDKDEGAIMEAEQDGRQRSAPRSVRRPY
mmetsp:Transcript_10317/g.22370  ORF Transcript_10317/g.22370 Transcript_10317/m.22370 type:complete len:450 (+) Transcript_10317:70-1419(+)